METEKNKSQTGWNREQVLTWGLAILAIIALVDAVIISIHHFLMGPTPEYAYTLGIIPTAPAGIIIQVVMLVLIAVFMKTKNPVAFTLIQGLVSLMFLEGIVAFYTQTFVLRFFCEYAYLFVVVSTLMFACIILLRGIRKTTGDQS